ncbi:hypothetical protein CCUS01_02688 [Colletotrichum cuscutae]|uniref:Uncharacterized protein n=1 Tax=Colletotrichum cuscutae TaxID=1209917 RepID=A0AAJ0DQX5_9PEZI|nr:hypothetical protein CCUS01_02688 [Colletotrichum cuscutae]
MDLTHYNPRDSPFVTILDVPKFGTLYYKIGEDNPTESRSTSEVVDLAVTIMENRFYNLHLESGDKPGNPDSELKQKFCQVIAKIKDTIPREKLFVSLKVQVPEQEALEAEEKSQEAKAKVVTLEVQDSKEKAKFLEKKVLKFLNKFLTESLASMKLKSVDLIILHDENRTSETAEMVWKKLIEEVTAQKDGKGRAQFLGVRPWSSQNDTFVLVEGLQTPAVYHQQALVLPNYPDLKSWMEARKHTKSSFVRLAKVPKTKITVHNQKSTWPFELVTMDTANVLASLHGKSWPSTMILAWHMAHDEEIRQAVEDWQMLDRQQERGNHPMPVSRSVIGLEAGEAAGKKEREEESRTGSKKKIDVSRYKDAMKVSLSPYHQGEIKVILDNYFKRG